MLIDIIRQFNLTPVRVSDRYYKTVEHDSLVFDDIRWFWNSRINPNTGKPLSGSAFDFVLLMTGDIELAKEYGELIPYYSLNSFANSIEVNMSNNNQFVNGYKTVNEYLESRGITQLAVDKFGIMWYSDFIIFPVETFIGNRIGEVIRHTDAEYNSRYTKQFNGNKPPSVWPKPMTYSISPETNIFLFEGFFSTMKWWQVDNNNAYFSVMGTKFNEAISTFSGYSNVFVICDYDDSGATVYAQLKGTHINPIMPDKMPDEMEDIEIKNFLRKIGI